MKSFGLSSLAVLASLMLGANAQQASNIPITSYCDADSGLCASINIPEDTNSTDTFFQITGADEVGWTAVGVGGRMAGALMFLIYASEDGQGVTLSPRLGKGHVEPLFEESIDAELLPGSGIVNNTLVANFRCGNCREWDGGSLDITSNQQDFIWAVGGGVDMRSDEQDESINHHSEKGAFTMNLVKATGGSGETNPFAGRALPEKSNEGAGGGNTPASEADKLLIAHGVLMGIAWIILFPTGAAIIRLFKDRFGNPMAVHRALQIANTVLVVLAMVLGIAASGINGTHFTRFHQYFGVILIGLLFVQICLGILHHSNYKKLGKRTLWSYAHIWLGRSVIAGAIINGGIGLGIMNASKGAIAVYAVFAVLVTCGYSAYAFIRAKTGPPSNAARLP